MINRRQFIESVAAVSLNSGASLYSLPSLANAKPWKSHCVSQIPEWYFDAQAQRYVMNPDFKIRHSVCLQCHGECGIRAKVSRKDGRLIRLVGNPWHPNTRVNYLNMGVKVDDTAARPGTLCARGVSGVQTLYDPCRITMPLKRTGPRGSNRWTPISWDQLIKEVVEGGKLFSEVDESFK